MKQLSDYDQKIVRLFNYLDTGPTDTTDQLIIRTEEFCVKEKPTYYEMTSGSRFKKAVIGQPVSLNPHNPMIEIFCLPDQIEVARELLRKALHAHTLKMLDKFNRWKAQIEEGSVLMNEAEYRDFTFSIAGKSSAKKDIGGMDPLS